MFAVGLHLLLLLQGILLVTAATTVNPKPDPCVTDITCIGDFSEPVRDRFGCYTCACPTNTCMNVKCSAGHECQMIQTKQCFTTPCFPDPICVPTVEVADEKPKTVQCLKHIECTGEYCEAVKDKNGCYSCACPTSTCANVRCAGGPCEMRKPKQCSSRPCLAGPVCVPAKECPMPKCLPICRPGVGPDGCPVCDCPKTCEETKCDDGQTCVMEEVDCIEEPCDTQPRCIPQTEPSDECTTAVCKSPCEPDFGPGSNGCLSVCACPKTCKDKKCGKNEECRLVKITCFRAPCFPVPTCFPKGS